MYIKLTAEWCANPPGSILNIQEGKARELIKRGSAYEINEENSSQEAIYEPKEISEPEKHKMFLKRNANTK